jgi:hypothetical protein
VTSPSESDDKSRDKGAPSLWQELGLREPKPLDERLAPPVDRELLLKLVRKELPEAAARSVYRLIVMFESWRQVHGEILAEEAGRAKPPGDASPNS